MAPIIWFPDETYMVLITQYAITVSLFISSISRPDIIYKISLLYVEDAGYDLDSEFDPDDPDN
jgi:hypothetical protein